MKSRFVQAHQNFSQASQKCVESTSEEWTTKPPLYRPQIRKAPQSTNRYRCLVTTVSLILTFLSPSRDRERAFPVPLRGDWYLRGATVSFNMIFRGAVKYRSDEPAVPYPRPLTLSLTAGLGPHPLSLFSSVSSARPSVRLSASRFYSSL